MSINTIPDGADIAEGSTTDAPWSGAGPGTAIAIMKKMATGGTGGGPATIADGADVAQGATTDAAVTTDTNATISSRLRGLVNILASAWDNVNGWLKVSVQNAVAVSGSVAVSNFPATQPISAAALPLAPNAAQETGGNLDKLTPLQGASGLTTSGPMVQGKVSDSRESYQDTEIRPLSITTDGRLRVASSESSTTLEFFRSDDMFFDVPDLTDSENPFALASNPWP